MPSVTSRSGSRRLQTGSGTSCTIELCSGGSTRGPISLPASENVRKRCSRTSVNDQPVRSDDPDVGPDRLRAPDALERLLLEHAQELRLEVERQVADLVQEERAVVGELEAPEPSRDGARERAPLVSEQLALQEPGGDGGAVELDERTAPPPAQPVNQAGDQLLAGSGLAPDEDRRIGRRHRLDQAKHALERRAPADDAVEIRRTRSGVSLVDGSLFGP